MLGLWNHQLHRLPFLSLEEEEGGGGGKGLGRGMDLTTGLLGFEIERLDRNWYCLVGENLCQVSTGFQRTSLIWICLVSEKTKEKWQKGKKGLTEGEGGFYFLFFSVSLAMYEVEVELGFLLKWHTLIEPIVPYCRNYILLNCSWYDPY